MAKKPAKSPINVVRDIKTINNDYANVCAKIGEADFKIKGLQKDIETNHKRLAEILVEYNEAMIHAQKKANEETAESVSA